MKHCVSQTFNQGIFGSNSNKQQSNANKTFFLLSTSSTYSLKGMNRRRGGEKGRASVCCGCGCGCGCRCVCVCVGVKKRKRVCGVYEREKERER